MAVYKYYTHVILNIFITFIYIILHVRAHRHMTQHIWISEDNFKKSVFPSHHVGYWWSQKDLQAWWQLSLPNNPSHWRYFKNHYDSKSFNFYNTCHFPAILGQMNILKAEDSVSAWKKLNLQDRISKGPLLKYKLTLFHWTATFVLQWIKVEDRVKMLTYKHFTTT